MAQYPTSAATDADLHIAVNNLSTTLNGAIDGSTTTVILTDASSFPTSGFVTIDAEAIQYTGKSGNQLTGVTRGADGTTGAPHSNGALVLHTVVAAHHNALKEEVKAVETDLVNTKSALNDGATPASTSTNLKDRLDHIVTQIKALAKGSNWYDAIASAWVTASHIATDAVETLKIKDLNVTEGKLANNAVAFGKLNADLQGLWGYRRPVLNWASVTQVDIENNTDTANETTVIFPDGDERSVVEDTSSTHQYRRFDITATASLVATHDSGLRSGESEAANTWWAIYAVKTTDDASKFVLVGTQTEPKQSNYATLNGYFGANGWVYLGYIINDVSSNIIRFYMSGNTTQLLSAFSLAVANPGTSLTWTYSGGMGAAQVPTTIGFVYYHMYYDTNSDARIRIYNTIGGIYYAIIGFRGGSGSGPNHSWWAPAKSGAVTDSSVNVLTETRLYGFIDTTLGVGANPII